MLVLKSVELGEMLDTAAKTAQQDDATASLNGVPASEIRLGLERILRSRAFIHSHRIRRFLQFVVEESLLGQPHRLKEYLIGLEVFDRREVFDPRVDSIVRVEARRLRNKIEEYYRTEGREDQVRIVLRKGSYVPIFEYRSAGAAGLGPTRRRTIEIAQFSFVNPPANAAPVADEVKRRLAHVLIKEGFYQVVSRPQPTISEPQQNGHTRTTKPDYIVEGSMEFHQDNFRLILQLLDAADGSYVWSEAAACQMQDLACVEQLGKSLKQELVSALNEAVLGRRHAEGESYDLYLQGRYHWKQATPDSIRSSVSYFTRAIEHDENYAAAWAALAQALMASSMLGFLAPAHASSRMKEAALRATSLNDRLPEAHVALGSVLSILDWDWAGGEKELQKAVQLDGHDQTCHIAYGIQMACRGVLDSAVAEVERALELDPASLFPNCVLGWLYGVCRRYDDAIALHRLVAQLAPDYALSYLGLGLAHAGKGMFQDAIAHFSNAGQLMKSPSLLGGCLGYCYAMSGRKDEALREIGILTKQADSQYTSPMSFAAIHSGLGDKQRALDYLDQAFDIHDTSLPLQMLNPEFDSLRNEPGFRSLRERMGLDAL